MEILYYFGYLDKKYKEVTYCKISKHDIVSYSFKQKNRELYLPHALGVNGKYNIKRRYLPETLDSIYIFALANTLFVKVIPIYPNNSISNSIYVIHELYPELYLQVNLHSIEKSDAMPQYNA